MTLQEIKDAIAPHLNLEELMILSSFVERRIRDVERADMIRRDNAREAQGIIFMRLSKVSNREDVEKHSQTEVDKPYEGTCDEMPTVGKQFFLIRTTLQRTSVVTELLPNNQFKTKHSVYKYEIL